VKRCRPYGDDDWTIRTAAAHNLEHTIRSEGRPKKPVAGEPGERS
jgi:hypothetical protein